MGHQGTHRMHRQDAGSRVSVPPAHRWKPTRYEHCEMTGSNVRSDGRPWDEVVADLFVRERDAGAVLLTPREVGVMLNVSNRTLGKWRQHGKGPRFVRLGYNKVVYRMEAAMGWVGARSEL